VSTLTLGHVKYKGEFAGFKFVTDVDKNKPTKCTN